MPSRLKRLGWKGPEAALELIKVAVRSAAYREFDQRAIKCGRKPWC